MKYTVNYKIENFGDSVELLSVNPSSEYITRLFYEGKVLRNVYLQDNGSFEITVFPVFSHYEEYDTLGIVSLVKTC